MHQPHRLIFHVGRAVQVDQVCAAQIGVFHVPDEARSGQIRTAQVGSAQLHREHDRAPKLGLLQVGPFGKADRQVASGQVGAGQIGAVHHRGCQIGVLEVDPGQVQVREILGAEVGRSLGRRLGQSGQDLVTVHSFIAGKIAHRGHLSLRQLTGQPDQWHEAGPERPWSHVRARSSV